MERHISKDNLDLSSLYRRRRNLMQKLHGLGHLLRGSLVELGISCGRPGCRCQRGEKHRSTYLSLSLRGKTKMIYVPKTLVLELQGWIANYHKAKAIIEELSWLNAQILRSKSRTRTERRRHK